MSASKLPYGLLASGLMAFMVSTAESVHAEEMASQTAGQALTKDAEQPQCAAWMKHSIKALHDNKHIDLCKATAGKPVLVVNTASHCGFTNQFEGLEKLYQKYRDQGLVIIGFPSNDFNQEAATEEEVAKVCRYNFGVTFLMTAPVQVKGEQAHPVFQHLNDQQGEPSWNFNKYLVDRNGEVVDRYSSVTSPNAWWLKKAVEISL